MEEMTMRLFFFFFRRNQTNPRIYDQLNSIMILSFINYGLESRFIIIRISDSIIIITFNKRKSILTKTFAVSFNFIGTYAIF